MQQDPAALNVLCTSLASQALWGNEVFWAEYRRRFDVDVSPEFDFWADWLRDPQHQATCSSLPEALTRADRPRAAAGVALTLTRAGCYLAVPMVRRILIGIAGGSGSGKTLVARNIVRDLGSDRVVIIDQDSYYKNLEDIPLPRPRVAQLRPPRRLRQRAAQAPHPRAARRASRSSSRSTTTPSTAAWTRRATSAST